MTTNTWPEIMISLIRPFQNNNQFLYIISIAYFIGVVLIGNFILLQLFLTIIIHTFGESKKYLANKKLKNNIKKMKNALKFKGFRNKKLENNS